MTTDLRPAPPREPPPLPTGIARGTRYFVELECLRGVAISLVVLFHADGLVRFPFRLLHMPVLWYSLTTARPIFGLPGAWSVGNVVWLVAALAATVAASAVTYRLIEQPFLRRKARLVAPGSRESGP